MAARSSQINPIAREPFQMQNKNSTEAKSNNYNYHLIDAE